MAEPNHLGGYVAGGDPKTWYPELWEWAYDKLGVRSVLDVGCGEGHTVKFFADLGCAVMGVDGSLNALATSVVPDHQAVHDFTEGPFDAARFFDLVWSCEFVEHVEEQYAANFLRTFAASSYYLMMSHALPGQGGYHHVNCQPSSYWVRRVQEYGFAWSYRLTRTARLLAGPGYFRRSGLVFVRLRHPKPPQSIWDRVFLGLLSAEWLPRRVWWCFASPPTWEDMRKPS